MKWYQYVRFGAVKNLTLANQDLFKRLTEAELALDKRTRQFQMVQKLLADSVDIPLSALSQDLAKIKQGLGILKATENKADAQHELLTSYTYVANRITLQQKIPYRELERLQRAIEQIQTANHELQQWSGEGKDHHVKP